MEFQYDLFISYSSPDRPWAEKLALALRARNIKVFLDKDRLDVGVPWEPQLATAVQGSQHLIALWTNNANDSQWVRREVGYFETINDPATRPQGNQDNRWYSFLLLEGENRAYSSVESISDLREANAYVEGAEKKGADAVNESLWEKVVTRLASAIRQNDKSTPIPLAVLAMTKDELERLNPNEDQPLGVPSLNSLLSSLGIGNREALLQSNSYGVQRADWHPFGHPLNVQQILDNVLFEINKGEADKTDDKKTAEGQFEFRWAPIDPRFWIDRNVRTTEQTKLLSTFSVIVIDPLSLYDKNVYSGLVTLSECFNSDRANIMVLTPFTLPQPFIDLSTLIETRGFPFFTPYLDPPVPKPLKYANLGVNLGNERELKRVVRAGVGQYVRSSMPTNKAFSQ